MRERVQELLSRQVKERTGHSHRARQVVEKGGRVWYTTRPSTHSPTSKVQRCGVSPMFVLAVDVFRCGELPHTIQVPLLGGIQEGRVSSEQVSNVAV